jgi:hypothetical protein
MKPLFNPENFWIFYFYRYLANLDNSFPANLLTVIFNEYINEKNLKSLKSFSALPKNKFFK